MAMALWSVDLDGGRRLARGPSDQGPTELLEDGLSLTDILSSDAHSLQSALSAPSHGPVPSGTRIFAPIPDELVWASGVTYERSLSARREESEGPDFYGQVYEADRPELFIKSPAGRVRGPDDPIAVRADSEWNVPEPELGVVADSRQRIVAYVIGNDVSSRSIEGQNPLYLPQAKTYDGSCAIGPCLVPVEDAAPLEELRINLTISRDGAVIFDESVDVARMRRSPKELVSWLFRSQEFPRGVVLLTGTGIVPDGDLNLQPRDEVAISASGLGVLRNVVA